MVLAGSEKQVRSYIERTIRGKPVQVIDTKRVNERKGVTSKADGEDEGTTTINCKLRGSGFLYSTVTQSLW
jgi:hypothetical protein